MSSNRMLRSRCTVVTRLTLWQTLFCTLFCAAILVAVSKKMALNAENRIDHEVVTEVKEFGQIYEKGGLEGLRQEFMAETESHGADNIFCRILSSKGELLFSTNMKGWTSLGTELEKIQGPIGNSPVLHTLYSKDPPLNARMASLESANGSVLQFGMNLQFENRLNRKIRRILIHASLLFLISNIIFSWFIAHQAMNGVRKITKTVDRIRKDSLDQFLPTVNYGREIDELANSFNGMLGRIQALVREIKEVSDNIAHDLRSPVTRMRGAAETTLTGPQTLETYREMGLTILEESDRLSEIINTTLEISQVEAGLLAINRQPVDLRTILDNAVELFQPMMEEKAICMELELPQDPLVLNGDRTRIQRVIANILDNAVKYTPDHGTIRIRAAGDSREIRIEISDTGFGVAQEDRERIFERFYRGEKSRSSPGNGLGLSLARTIIHIHGGTLSVHNNPDKGCTFTVILPRAFESGNEETPGAG